MLSPLIWIVRLKQLRLCPRRALAIPVIVAGEFAFGIAQSRHREAYERSMQRMLDRCTVLEIGIETARHYAAIRLELQARVSQFRPMTYGSRL